MTHEKRRALWLTLTCVTARSQCGTLPLMIFELLLSAAAMIGTPCTTVSPDCTEWIKPAGQQSRVLIYRNYPLETKNATMSVGSTLLMGSDAPVDRYQKPQGFSVATGDNARRSRASV